MSNGDDKHSTQSPEELAAVLGAMLAEAVGPEAMRDLEPQAAFSAGLTWRYAQDETQT